MRFSVIIPSFLGPYQYAASNRKQKLVRAIDSAISQKFKDFEIIVVADGCEETYSLIEDRYSDVENLDCLLIRKQVMWSGAPRNYGIGKASGEYIVYLDSDDYWGDKHLSIIDGELKKNNDPDWVWFNDLLKKKDGTHYERQCIIHQRFQNGTSNICHKRNLVVKWQGSGYGLDDWSVVTQLNRYQKNAKIRTPEYFVCHLQQGLDV